MSVPQDDARLLPDIQIQHILNTSRIFQWPSLQSTAETTVIATLTIVPVVPWLTVLPNMSVHVTPLA